MTQKTLHKPRALASALILAALVLFAGLLPGTAHAAPGKGASRSKGSTETIVIPADRFSAETTDESLTDGTGNDSDRRFNFDGFRSQVMGLWFKRKVFLLKNLPDAAAEQTTAIERLCSEVGVTRLDDVAAALIHEGRTFLEEGNFDKARISFNDASRFAPDLPEAHFGMARALWRSGAGTGSAMSEFVAGLRTQFRNSALSSAFLGNALIIAMLAIAATIALYSIAMLLRYQALLRHDIEELLSRRRRSALSKDAMRMASWGVLLLPLVTWIAALWTPAYWIALTFRYQKFRERVISGVLLGLVIAAIPAARATEILFGLAADPSARLMLASTSGSYDPEQIVALEQKADANPHDPAYRFLLGGLYARGRYFQDALSQYQRAIALDPSSYRAWTNLGNLYLRSGRAEEALKHYKNAVAQRDDFLPAWYNSYLARKELLQLREAEQALEKAQSIDPKGLAALIEDEKSRGPAEPVEAIITRDEVFRRVLGDQSGGSRIFGSLVSLPSILALLFLAAGIASLFVAGGRHATRCVRCGEAFCDTCKIGDRVEDYCSQCQHIAIARDAISPVIRREKTEQAEKFRERQVRAARIGSLLLPGMGRLLDGRTLSGAPITVLWCWAVLSLLLRPYVLQPQSAGSGGPLFAVTCMLALVALVAWTFGNLRVARNANAPAGAWEWR